MLLVNQNFISIREANKKIATSTILKQSKPLKLRKNNKL